MVHLGLTSNADNITYWLCMMQLVYQGVCCEEDNLNCPQTDGCLVGIHHHRKFLLYLDHMILLFAMGSLF